MIGQMPREKSVFSLAFDVFQAEPDSLGVWEGEKAKGNQLNDSRSQGGFSTWGVETQNVKS